MKYKRKDRKGRKQISGRGVILNRVGSITKMTDITPLVELLRPITAEELASVVEFGPRIRSISGPSIPNGRKIT